MVAKEKAEFMKQMIDEHNLLLLAPQDAMKRAPFREESYFDTVELARTTSYFENMDILVADDNYVYPPLSAFEKSFDKWLALQEQHQRRATA